MSTHTQKELSTYLWWDIPFTAVQMEDATIYCRLGELCSLLSLDEAQQLTHWQQHPILAAGLLIEPEFLIRYDLIAYWLATIPLPDVPTEKQQMLEQFQQETAVLLSQKLADGYFHTFAGFAELTQADTLAAEAYRQALAHLCMARDQLYYEAAGA